MGKYTNEEVEIDLMDLLYTIKSKLWIIILSGLMMAFAAGLYSTYMITPIYTSKTQLYILSKSTSITSLADIQIGTQLTQDYMVLIKSRPVVNQVIENLYLDMTYEEMQSKVSVSNQTNTRVLEIRVNYPNAYLAKQIADEFANVSTEQIAKIMATEKPNIVDEGNLPKSPSSPNIKRNALIGGMLGGLLAAGIVLFFHMLDDTIKGSDDVEKYLELSTIGLIPIENGKSTKINSKKEKYTSKRQKVKRG
ncbi:MAG: polysaccharide export protein [Anaerolineaceae bacterium]|nr:MAG: polysaccharide export protein [Anaerolineaceae bacterium]